MLHQRHVCYTKDIKLYQEQLLLEGLFIQIMFKIINATQTTPSTMIQKKLKVFKSYRVTPRTVTS